MDGSRCAHAEGRRKKENTSGDHCQDVETNKAGDSLEGIQFWFVTRFTRLIRLNSNQWD
jgi:hypothetical protein